MSDKSFTIHPEITHHFWWFVIGIFLIPLLGAGIYIIYRKYHEIRSNTYIFTDRQIICKNQKFTDTIDLADIRGIDLAQRWIDIKFDIGTLTLRTNSRSIGMFGIKNPETISGMIMSAAEAERLRLSQPQISKRTDPERSAGTLDRLDYLTGLWQQGLISDEDFLKERKYFED